MRRASPFIVFVVFLLVLAAESALPQTPEDQLAMCGASQTSIPAQRVVDACTALIDFGKNEEHGLSYLNRRRGAARQRLGQWDLALADFNEAVRLLPKEWLPYSDRADAYLKQRDYQSAIRDFDRASLIQRGKRPETLNMQCLVRVIAGVEFPAAKIACDKALMLRPNNPDILDTRGLLALKLGDNQAALNDYSIAVRWKPESAASLYGLGIVLQRLGRAEEGRARIAAAIAADPKIADQYKEYGVAP